MELHIGKEIRRVLDEKGKKGNWLAEKMNTSTRNLYDLLNREEISTGQLSVISNALEYNFFELFNRVVSAPGQVNEPEQSYAQHKKSVQQKVVVMVELDGLETTLDHSYDKLKKLNKALV